TPRAHLVARRRGSLAACGARARAGGSYGMPGGRRRMKRSSLVHWLSTLGVAAVLMVGAASAADVRVMISAGFYGVYSELGPAFERASGHRLVTTRGPSMGDSPEAIPTRLTRGEAADVVILDGGPPTSSASGDWCAPTAKSSSLADRHGGARRSRKAGYQQRRGTPQHAACSEIHRLLGQRKWHLSVEDPLP